MTLQRILSGDVTPDSEAKRLAEWLEFMVCLWQRHRHTRGPVVLWFKLQYNRSRERTVITSENRWLEDYEFISPYGGDMNSMEKLVSSAIAELTKKHFGKIRCKRDARWHRVCVEVPVESYEDLGLL